MKRPMKMLLMLPSHKEGEHIQSYFHLNIYFQVIKTWWHKLLDKYLYLEMCRKLFASLFHRIALSRCDESHTGQQVSLWFHIVSKCQYNFNANASDISVFLFCSSLSLTIKLWSVAPKSFIQTLVQHSELFRLKHRFMCVA